MVLSLRINVNRTPEVPGRKLQAILGRAFPAGREQYYPTSCTRLYSTFYSWAITSSRIGHINFFS